MILMFNEEFDDLGVSVLLINVPFVSSFYIMYLFVYFIVHCDVIVKCN